MKINQEEFEDFKQWLSEQGDLSLSVSSFRSPAKDANEIRMRFIGDSEEEPIFVFIIVQAPDEWLGH